MEQSSRRATKGLPLKLNRTQDQRIFFVILHYLALDDTIECIQSIEENIQSSLDKKIIVVDNGSPDGSGRILDEKYAAVNHIEVLCNEKNYGFSKGNNVGYMHAKKCDADFIVMINNDTIISQVDFLDVIVNEYKRKAYHVLGPDILSKSGVHQNPVGLTFRNLDQLQKSIRHARFRYWLTYLGLDEKLIEWKKSIFGGSSIQAFRNAQNVDWKVPKDDVKLHGSAMIFSKDFISKYDGLYPETFLYSEEDILYFKARYEGLVLRYTPNVQIFHKEDVSTNKMVTKSGERKRFYYKHYVASKSILLDMIKKYEHL